MCGMRRTDICLYKMCRLSLWEPNDTFVTKHLESSSVDLFGFANDVFARFCCSIIYCGKKRTQLVCECCHIDRKETYTWSINCVNCVCIRSLRNVLLDYTPIIKFVHSQRLVIGFDMQL